MLVELSETVTERAIAFGVDRDAAGRLGRAVAERMRHRYGGCEVYVQLTDRVQRDAAVLAAFNGRNRDRVCQRFGISRATFYRILHGRAA